MERDELWATCPTCGWTWCVYHSLPAPVHVVTDRMKHARCPNCPIMGGYRGRAPLMATEAQIVAALKRGWLPKKSKR